MSELLDRQALVENNLSIVYRVAKKRIRFMPKNIELEDLVAYGVFGLISAAKKFDPSRGFKFVTYAGHKIAGSISDELRIGNRSGHGQRIQAQSLEEKGELYLPAHEHYTPEHRMTEIEISEAVHRAVDALPLCERQVITMRHFQNLKRDEIGKKLNRSEAWVSIVHTRALGRLRKKLSVYKEYL